MAGAMGGNLCVDFPSPIIVCGWMCVSLKEMLDELGDL
jgi:hypothetical protein